MLKLQIQDIVIFGIDKNNINALQNNKPMLIDTTKFKNFNKIVVMYGDTIDEVIEDIEKLTGLKIPDLSELKQNEEVDLADQINSLNQTKQ